MAEVDKARQCQGAGRVNTSKNFLHLRPSKNEKINKLTETL